MITRAKRNEQPEGQAIILASVVFLSFVGISLSYPIFGPLILNDINSIASTSMIHDLNKTVLLGILLATYPLGQFIGLPILGILSDMIGRKKVLVISLGGTAAGYFLSTLAIYYHDLVFLYLSRFMTGLCEGNFAVAQAAITEISQGNNKTKYYGWLNSAVALGYIIGPLLGGITADNSLVNWFNYETPFMIATLVAVIAMLFVHYCFKEQIIPSFAETNACKHGYADFLVAIISLYRNDRTRRALVIFLFFYLGIDLFYEFYPMYFVINWQFNTIEVAVFSAIYAIAYAISQILLVPMLGKYFNPKSILSVIGFIGGATLLLMIIPNHYQSLYVTLPLLGILISFCSTNVAVILSDSTHLDSQGKVFGIAQSMRVLNDCVFAIIAGRLAVLNTGMPLLLAGFIMLIAALLAN